VELDVGNWPIGAVRLDRVTTAAIEGATDQSGFRQWIAAPIRRRQRDGERVTEQNHEHSMASNPGQETLRAPRRAPDS
jgi:hypothetical protein